MQLTSYRVPTCCLQLQEKILIIAQFRKIQNKDSEDNVKKSHQIKVHDTGSGQKIHSGSRH
jgi:hypothetical protein